MKIFVINPGSTTTKLAVYEDDEAVLAREFQHEKTELARFPSVIDQLEYRMDALRRMFDESSIDAASIAAIAGRGGLLHPLEGGVYEVSDEMISDLSAARYGEHPCNLGAIMARRLSDEWHVPAYIVDPVVTDEMMDEARLTGLPGIRRRSLFHALNQRGAARTVAGRLGVVYEQSRFIVCHMGGGISIGAHRLGRVVDVINALDGEGPFSPERTGGLPVISVLDMIERGQETPARLKQIILREGGVFAHLGTNDPREVIRRMERGDESAQLVFNAFAYGVAKNIASLAPALVDENGMSSIDAVILTGGVARSVPLVGAITRMVSYLGKVEVVTGEEEMSALADGAVRVLAGKERCKVYVGIEPGHISR